MFRLSLTLILLAGLTFAATTPSYPVLTYSTYLRDSFTPKAIASDSAGNIYLAGNATVDPAAPQTTVLVVKLNPQATQYLYLRYLGGSVNDYANALAVDRAGNAYVAGSTASPDFPVTAGGNLGTPSTGAADQRSFVAKFDPTGNVVFSNLLGGSAPSSAQAVAVTPAGQVLVSGACGLGSGACTAGFSSTAGAYSIPNSANHPYLLQLDPTGTKVVFSATGIGGSAIALDSSGNIYVAGTTYLLDYPTTPGAYQTKFPAFDICGGPSCFGGNQGANQYVSKIDPTGSKLIYSTAVSGSASTTNAGLAVDAAGNAYLTGFAAPSYPFTVTAPTLSGAPPFTIFASPFLSKLDPAGQTLLFSVPVGGAGVQLDSSGNVYVGGGVGFSLLSRYAVPASIPALANVPPACVANASAQSFNSSQSVQNSAYVSQVDAASGNVLGTQYIGGSALNASAVALSGSTLWIAGADSRADFPFTPGVLTIPNLPPNALAGAYLGAIDFSRPQPPAGTPQIGCIVDSANLAQAGPAARYQLLTIYGTGLGPVTGVGAGDLTYALAGVTVTFSGVGAYTAPLLYVSASQINFAVPLVTFGQPSSSMQVSVNGVASSTRQLPLTYESPNVFLDNPQPASSTSFGPTAVALNADGSRNSAANPARLGSAVSVFVNGLTPDPDVTNAPIQLTSNHGWSVTKIAPATQFVTRVDLQVPSQLVNDFACGSSLCTAAFTLNQFFDDGSVGQVESFSGLAFGGVVYVNRN